MEKEALIAGLREKSGVDNLSERTISEVADAALPMFADDEKVTDDTWKPFVQMLRSVSGQYRHDVADGIAGGKSQWEKEAEVARRGEIANAVAAAKAEWEKTIKEQVADPNQKETPDIAKLVAESVAAAIKEQVGDDGAIGKMNKQFTDFMARVEQEKKDSIIKSKRDALKEYLLDERMADREPVVNLAIKDLEIAVDSDIDKLKVLAEKKYEALYKEFYGDAFGAPFAGGAGGVGNGQDSKAEFDKFIAEKKAEAQKEADDAEELQKLMM